MTSIGNAIIPYRWLSARLQYLHCWRTGDTAVWHYAINVIFKANNGTKTNQPRQYDFFHRLACLKQMCQLYRVLRASKVIKDLKAIQYGNYSISPIHIGILTSSWNGTCMPFLAATLWLVQNMKSGWQWDDIAGSNIKLSVILII